MASDLSKSKKAETTAARDPKMLFGKATPLPRKRWQRQGKNVYLMSAAVLSPRDFGARQGVEKWVNFCLFVRALPFPLEFPPFVPVFSVSSLFLCAPILSV